MIRIAAGPPMFNGTVIRQLDFGQIRQVADHSRSSRQLCRHGVTRHPAPHIQFLAIGISRRMLASSDKKSNVVGGIVLADR